MKTIVFNSADIETDAQTLWDLLAEHDVPAEGVAVAIDGAVVPRSRWRSIELSPGQEVDVLTATQGG